MTGSECDLTGYWTRLGIATGDDLADDRYRRSTFRAGAQVLRASRGYREEPRSR